ncbi:tRNA (adenosine(37)-N6)-threonylcarbamoyltransferase complex dimerization subunit type 1 TsaB [Luteimonas sp. A478]
MKLIAFETSTEACSVALWCDGDVLERFEIAPRRHAELALPWAQDLLAEAGMARSQLDAVAVGRGPGAFTGVRLGIALSQGIALALDLPMLPVSTLAALALRAEGPGKVLAAIDARMGEVYAGMFERAGTDLAALGPETVSAPDAVQLPAGDDRAWHGVGTGFDAVEGALQATLGPRLVSVDATALPRAGDVARLAVQAFLRGELVAPELVEPAYLRDNVALTLEEQRALRAAR